jgi:hypothetical protein
MCNCNKNCHKVETVTATATNVVLTVTDSNNISSLDCFNFSTGCKSVNDVVTGVPLPVQITVNGVAVSLLNKYSLPILSNRVPCRSRGAYVVPDGGTPYVILFDTPPCKCYA